MCGLGTRATCCSPRTTGREARLFDARNDPQQGRDLAEVEPTTVERMFEEYVLKDAGDSLPS